jgi:transcriptional regulator with XRE-family HTH domain
MRSSRGQFERVVYETRFDRFLAANDVDLDVLADEVGTTRQNLGRLRAGSRSPRQDTIAKIVIALRRMLGRSIAASDLFYLGEERDDHTPEAAPYLRRVA